MVVRFSQRMGLKPVRAEIQKDSMDESLKNGLWNALYAIILSGMKAHGYDRDSYRLAAFLWDSYFNLPLDEIPPGELFVGEIRNYINSCEWFEVYDLMEEVLKHTMEPRVKSRFLDGCKTVLQRELSGFRLIDGKFVPIVSDNELEEIERALRVAPDPVREHLKQALSHFSDRQNPVYRNSIKESISAVEALCKLITEESNTTLGKAVNLISNSGVVSFHPSFAQALKRLYGWTNNADGIRHSLMDESNLSQEDARFMLVSCSAFTNYLIVKADKAGIELRQ